MRLVLLLPCCAERRRRKLAAAAECELLLASIETLGGRLDGLRADVAAAMEQSRSAETAELRTIQREHDVQKRLTAEAVKEQKTAQQKEIEARTELQRHGSTLAKLIRRRQQLQEELEVGEDGMRHAETGVVEAKGEAEGVLVVMKRKVHELEEMSSDQQAMEDLYNTQLKVLKGQICTAESEAAERIDREGLARAMLDFTASGDFEAHWETIVDKARLSPHEARRSRQQRLTNIERDPSDPY